MEIADTEHEVGLSLKKEVALLYCVFDDGYFPHHKPSNADFDANPSWFYRDVQRGSKC